MQQGCPRPVPGRLRPHWPVISTEEVSDGSNYVTLGQLGRRNYLQLGQFRFSGVKSVSNDLQRQRSLVPLATRSRKGADNAT